MRELPRGLGKAVMDESLFRNEDLGCLKARGRGK